MTGGGKLTRQPSGSNLGRVDAIGSSITDTLIAAIAVGGKLDIRVGRTFRGRLIAFDSSLPNEAK